MLSRDFVVDHRKVSPVWYMLMSGAMCVPGIELSLQYWDSSPESAADFICDIAFPLFTVVMGASFIIAGYRALQYHGCIDAPYVMPIVDHIADVSDFDL